MVNLRESYVQSPQKLCLISAKVMFNLRESYDQFPRSLEQSPRKLWSISAKVMISLRESYVQSPRKLCSISVKIMFNLRESYYQSRRKLCSVSAKVMINLLESYDQSPRKLCSISAKFMLNLREIYVQSPRNLCDRAGIWTYDPWICNPMRYRHLESVERGGVMTVEIYWTISTKVHYENTPIQIYWKFYNQKRENFQIKNSDIFHISAQNIDCGYSLEPPRRGGSNEYPQSVFWAEIRKIMYTPVNPSFTM